jgi:myo-inositol catabolism protein IolC
MLNTRASNMRWIRLAILFLLLPCSGSLSAQGFDSTNSVDRKHRDFAGKPCLEADGVSRPLASNPRILDHAVSLENHCYERIKVKVCYYHTDDCTDVDVPGNSRKEQIIGVFPAMEQFRYEVREQF